MLISTQNQTTPKMANRWVEEDRESEVLKTRTVKLGVERLHTQEHIGGYSLKAPQDYRLEAGKTMQYKSVPNVVKMCAVCLYVCACICFIYICIRIGIHVVRELLPKQSSNVTHA